jgi:hypothetical protein
MVLPFAGFQWRLGARYQGVACVFNDDELFYLARIRDVMDGHGGQGNAYLWERKREPALHVFLAEYMLAQPLALFGIEVTAGRVLYSALLVPLAFLLTYSILRRIGLNRFRAALGASFLFFGLFCFRFNRPVSPQFNFLFWLLEYLLLIRIVRGGAGREVWLAAALILGAVFNLYPYYWTHFAVWIAMLAGALLLRGERQLALGAMGVLGAGALLGVPYFYLAHRAGQLPYYWESLTRLGLVWTYFPSGLRVVAGSLLTSGLYALALRANWVRWDRETIFHLSGVASAAVVVNQHVITGMNLEFSAHYLLQSVFTGVFAMAHLWRNATPAWERRLAWAVPAILAAVVTLGFVGYCGRALTMPEGADRQQRLAEVFRWMRSNVAKDEVVLASEAVADLIPVYTSANVLYARNANLFLLPDDEVVERFAVTNVFEAFDREFLARNERAVFGVRHIDDYQHKSQANTVRRLFGIEPIRTERLPASAVDRVLKRALEIQREGWKASFNRFRLDLVLWDREAAPHWELDRRSGLVKAFDHPQFPVYRVCR